MPRDGSASRSRGSERHADHAGDGITMGGMERMMRRLLRSETADLATKEDLRQLKEESRNNAARIDQVTADVAELRKQIQEVREDPGRHAAASSGGTAAWKPRLVHVRGFAPYGSGVKLNKREANKFQEMVEATLTDHIRSKINALEPFVQNHQLSWNVRTAAAGYDDIAAVVDAMNMGISKAKLQYKGNDLKAMMEISPERRRAVKTFYEAREALATISQEGWESCGRSLKIYALPGYTELGMCVRNTGLWIWHENALSQHGWNVAAVKEAMEAKAR